MNELHKLKAKNFLYKIKEENDGKRSMFYLGAWVMANILGLVK